MKVFVIKMTNSHLKTGTESTTETSCVLVLLQTMGNIISVLGNDLPNLIITLRCRMRHVAHRIAITVAYE